MSKSKLLIFSLTAVFLFAVATQAQSTDEIRKAASDLVRMCMPKAQYESMIRTMSTQMGAKLLDDMKERGLDVPADFPERMSRTLLEVMPYEEQLQLATDAYVENFNLDEIKTMAAFYETPVGKKVLSLQPKIAGETMQKLMAKVGERLPAAMERNGLIPEHEEKSVAPATHPSTKSKTAPTK